jgi:glycosyltransferase involved in cell wall biosynthesis
MLTKVVALSSPEDYDGFNPVFTGVYLTEHSEWHFINSFAADLRANGFELITYAFSSTGKGGLYKLHNGEVFVRLIRPSRLALTLLKAGRGWRYLASLLNSQKLVGPLLEDSPKIIINTSFPHFPRGETVSILAKLIGKKFGYLQSITLPDKSPYDYVIRLFQRLTDFYVFTEAESIRDSKQRYFISSEKIHLINLLPNINAALWASKSDKRAQRVKTILYVGRLDDKQKAVSNLIKSFKNVVEQAPQVELRIVGEGFDRPLLENLVEKLGLTGKVHFVGWKSGKELADCYLSAYLFCLPSRRESYSLVVTEAMTAGLPVVCSDLPALRDRVVNGVTGLTVNVDNIEELSKKLLLVINNEEYASQLGANAKKKIDETLVYSHKQFVQVLKRVAEQR